MLPFMHRNFCLLGLVNVAVCDNRSIQQWALTLLEHSCYTDLKGTAEQLVNIRVKGLKSKSPYTPMAEFSVVIE